VIARAIRIKHKKKREGLPTKTSTKCANSLKGLTPTTNLQAQKPWDVDCDYIWTSYDVCSIVTADGTYNNETVAERHSGVAAAQKRYNANPSKP
jgi:hypothetical protein